MTGVQTCALPISAVWVTVLTLQGDREEGHQTTVAPGGCLAAAAKQRLAAAGAAGCQLGRGVAVPPTGGLVPPAPRPRELSPLGPHAGCIPGKLGASTPDTADGLSTSPKTWLTSAGSVPGQRGGEAPGITAEGDRSQPSGPRAAVLGWRWGAPASPAGHPRSQCGLHAASAGPDVCSQEGTLCAGVRARGRAPPCLCLCGGGSSAQ